MKDASKRPALVEKKKNYEGRQKPFVDRVHIPARYYERQEWYFDPFAGIELSPKEAIKLSVMFD